MSISMTAGIVTYNNSETIYKCIESIIKNSQYPDFKLYVYDNGSEDGTVEIIQNNFPQVELILSEKNIGFGGGHNQIVKRVHSDFHAIINPDLFIPESVLMPMAEYMAGHPDVVQMTTQIRNLDDTIQHLPMLDPNFKFVFLSKLKPFKKYRSIYTREFDTFDGPTEILSSTGCFSMVRTKAFKRVHGYDRRFFLYFEDADLSRRLRQIGKIIYQPDLHVYHAWKRDNTRNIRGICIFLNSMRKYYRKWMIQSLRREK